MRIEINVDTDESEEKVFNDVKRWLGESFWDLRKVRFKVIGVETLIYEFEESNEQEEDLTKESNTTLK